MSLKFLRIVVKTLLKSMTEDLFFISLFIPSFKRPFGLHKETSLIVLCSHHNSHASHFEESFKLEL